jgi:hypothetical protein
MGSGKILRWIDSLTDAQVEELVARISMACATTPAIEAKRIREVFREFLRVTPETQ